MLLIDCGNSATKCRLIKQGQSSDSVFRLSETSHKQLFRQFLQTHQPERIYLSSVASRHMTSSLKSELRKTLPLSHTIELHSLPELGGVINAYQDYTQLGVDRWLTLLAAYAQSQTDVIIIDAGSAITIDLLSRKHSHLGGAILPGFNTDRQRFISMFPQVDFNHPDILLDHEPGRSTAACLQMSEFPVTLARIRQLVTEWSERLEQPLKILLCGQDAGLISKKIGMPHEVVPDLVFQGMLQQIQLQG